LKKLILVLIIPFTIAMAIYAINNLANLLETKNVTIKDVTPFVYCSILHKGPYSDIDEVIGTLMQNMRTQNIFPAGGIISISYKSPDEAAPAELEWEVGFPVTPQALIQAPLLKKQWDHKVVAAATHVGSYDTIGDTITFMLAWMDAHHYTQTGPIMEKYLDIASQEIPKENLRTEIWIPCEKE